MLGDNGTQTIKSDETLLTIVDKLASLERAGVTELADYVEVSKSTVHRHLKTLEHHDLVFKTEGKYVLSYRFLDIGCARRHSEFERLQPTVRKVAEDSGEVASFGTVEQGDLVVIYRHTGENAVKTGVREGSHLNPVVSACGQAIIAFMPEDRRQAFYEEWIADDEEREQGWADFKRRIPEIRDQGFVQDRGIFIDRLRTVAAPVRGENDELLGSLLVAGPAHRFKGEVFSEEIPDLLLSSINEFELNVRHS